MGELGGVNKEYRDWKKPKETEASIDSPRNFERISRFEGIKRQEKLGIYGDENKDDNESEQGGGEYVPFTVEGQGASMDSFMENYNATMELIKKQKEAIASKQRRAKR